MKTRKHVSNRNLKKIEDSKFCCKPAMPSRGQDLAEGGTPKGNASVATYTTSYGNKVPKPELSKRTKHKHVWNRYVLQDICSLGRILCNDNTLVGPSYARRAFLRPSDVARPTGRRVC